MNNSKHETYTHQPNFQTIHDIIKHTLLSQISFYFCQCELKWMKRQKKMNKDRKCERKIKSLWCVDVEVDHLIVNRFRYFFKPNRRNRKTELTMKRIRISLTSIHRTVFVSFSSSSYFERNCFYSSFYFAIESNKPNDFDFVRRNCNDPRSISWNKRS